MSRTEISIETENGVTVVCDGGGGWRTGGVIAEAWVSFG